ncbi:M23 family metallopeptidase [Streptomyces sp. NPDC058623]|uniref:M23 family metallopeptidase n=1 Tax=Streptomyces sp. NPDC058623 TaxID=3346563 RepID=UPI0036573832
MPKLLLTLLLTLTALPLAPGIGSPPTPLRAAPVSRAPGVGPPPGAPAPGGRPLPPPLSVARWWDPPPTPYAAGHRGVDLSAPVGARVRAVGPGRVHHAGPVAGRGVLSLTLPGGLRTTYEPVRPLVAEGETVEAGQVVAVLTAGSHCTTPCLHWGLLAGEDLYRNPLTLLPRPTPRLLPTDPAEPPDPPASPPRTAPRSSEDTANGASPDEPAGPLGADASPAHARARARARAPAEGTRRDPARRRPLAGRGRGRSRPRPTREAGPARNGGRELATADHRGGGSSWVDGAGP